MTRRRRRDRLYWREGRGWYADLRDFADVGGKREAMVPEGQRHATQDRDEAVRILTARVDELKELRRSGANDRPEDPTLADYAKRHLEVKAGYRRASTVERDSRALENILAYFGNEIRLADVTVSRLTDYITSRRQQPGLGGNTIAAQTILHELHALSSLYRRAVSEGIVDTNPVARMVEKPRIERAEATWLEIGEGARLLKAAAEMDASPASRAVPYLLPILATFLLTGGRRAEVFGLELHDVDFEHRVVHFRDSGWRRLKRPRHRRHVPLWPQLEAILREHIERWGNRDGLICPAAHGGMLRDLRGSLEAAVKRAGIEKHVTLHTLRHTYAAARMQTLDHDAPVSPYTVMRELGHGSIALIEKTYGHLMNTRHRSAVVEYKEAEVLRLERAARGA